MSPLSPLNPGQARGEEATLKERLRRNKIQATDTLKRVMTEYFYRYGQGLHRMDGREDYVRAETQA
jgi:hypothetical protein